MKQGLYYAEVVGPAIRAENKRYYILHDAKSNNIIDISPEVEGKPMNVGSFWDFGTPLQTLGFLDEPTSKRFKGYLENAPYNADRMGTRLKKALKRTISRYKGIPVAESSKEIPDEHATQIQETIENILKSSEVNGEKKTELDNELMDLKLELNSQVRNAVPCKDYFD